MRLLPHWALTSPSPAFYDTESGSAIEQTARVYKAMQELIKEYNSFVADVNKSVVDIETSINKNYEEFTAGINKLVHDYIAMLDEKIKLQDKHINDTIVYIKENLKTALSEMLTEMKENGELDQTVLDVFSNIEITLEELINKINATDGKITQIETSISELTNAADAVNIKIRNIETGYSVMADRIEVLENTEYALVHDEATEELTLKKIVPGGS